MNDLWGITCCAVVVYCFISFLKSAMAVIREYFK